MFLPKPTQTLIVSSLVFLISFAACGDTKVARAESAEAPKQEKASVLQIPVSTKPLPAGLKDIGIFSDLDPSLQLPLFSKIDPTMTTLAVNKQKQTLTLLAAGTAVKTYPIVGGALLEGRCTIAPMKHESPAGLLPLSSGEGIILREADLTELCEVVTKGAIVEIAPGTPTGLHDADDDGIPDQVDILLGALKADANNASYDDGFYPIAKHLGDVPRNKGCCTDVVIRSLRNAGIDLQQAVQHDAKKNPKHYPFIKHPNPNIDHRRVKNLVPYFKRHFISLPVDQKRFMPGDILLFDTLAKAGPDHIGIVSAETTAEGAPLIINNWTYGAVTDPMALLSFVPVTHQFRVRAPDRK